MADIFVITPKFRGLYLNLVKPRASKLYPDQEPKYSLTAAFPPDTDFSKFEAALLAAAKDKGWPNIPKSIYPLKANGDLENPVKELPDDWKILRLSAKKEEAPDLIDRNGDEIYDPDALYSGAWFDSQVNVFVGDKPKKYVAVRMVRVRKLKDGDRLGRPPLKDRAPSMEGVKDDLDDLLD